MNPAAAGASSPRQAATSACPLPLPVSPLINSRTSPRARAPTNIQRPAPGFPDSQDSRLSPLELGQSAGRGGRGGRGRSFWWTSNTCLNVRTDCGPSESARSRSLRPLPPPTSLQSGRGHPLDQAHHLVLHSAIAQVPELTDRRPRRGVLHPGLRQHHAEAPRILRDARHGRAQRPDLEVHAGDVVPDGREGVEAVIPDHVVTQPVSKVMGQHLGGARRRPRPICIPLLTTAAHRHHHDHNDHYHHNAHTHESSRLEIKIE
eukprot:9504092-Pyramimonas_sp.AAC.2